MRPIFCDQLTYRNVRLYTGLIHGIYAVEGFGEAGCPHPEGTRRLPKILFFLAHYSGRIPSGCRRSEPEKRFLEGFALQTSHLSKPAVSNETTREDGSATTSRRAMIGTPKATAISYA